MTAYIYCNTGIVLAESAQLSPQDRGFRFGDGVFETIPIHQAAPYQWDFHLKRLREGLSALRIPEPAIEWRAQADALLSANGMTEGSLRIAVSRGVGSLGYLPQPGITPTVLMETLPARPAPAQPARLWLSTFQRPLPASFPTYAKTAQGLTSTLALLEAQDKGCDEALLLNARGEIAEAAAANMFWIADNTLFTPSLSTGCVEGSTRAAIMRLSSFPIESATAPLEALRHAEGAFLTNSRIGLWPIASIVPLDLHWPDVHPMIAALRALYAMDIDEVRG